MNIYHYFFRKESGSVLGLVRILFGIVLLISLVNDIPYVVDYWSDIGVVPNEAVDKYFRDYRFSVLDYVPSAEGVIALYATLLIAALFLTIGFKTRIASIVTFILLLSFNERNWLVLHSGDTLIRVIAFYLMITASGAAYSVDAVLRRSAGKSAQLIPAWHRIIIKVQVAIFYFFAGYFKTSGMLWQKGTAAIYPFLDPAFNRFSFSTLHSFPLIVKFMTWGSLSIELAAPFLLWIKRTRFIGIISVAFLQASIFFALNIGVFQLISFVVVLIFLEPSDLERFWRWLGKGKTYRVIYDGDCQICNRTINMIRCMDVMRVLKFTDFRKAYKKGEKKYKQYAQEVYVYEGKKDFRGFYAFRKLSLVIPGLWILIPLFYAPFSGTIGSWIYRYISKNRMHLGCKSCRVNIK